MKSPAIVPPGSESHWPPLLLGATDVHMRLHALYAGTVFGIEGFLTKEECRAWIEHGEEIGCGDAKDLLVCMIDVCHWWRDLRYLSSCKRLGGAIRI